jgi:hypothetical protein
MARKGSGLTFHMVIQVARRKIDPSQPATNQRLSFASLSQKYSKILSRAAKPRRRGNNPARHALRMVTADQLT